MSNFQDNTTSLLENRIEVLERQLEDEKNSFKLFYPVNLDMNFQYTEWNENGEAVIEEVRQIKLDQIFDKATGKNLTTYQFTFKKRKCTHYMDAFASTTYYPLYNQRVSKFHGCAWVRFDDTGDIINWNLIELWLVKGPDAVRGQHRGDLHQIQGSSSITVDFAEDGNPEYSWWIKYRLPDGYGFDIGVWHIDRRNV